MGVSKRWQLLTEHRELSQTISSKLQCSPVVSQVLLNRGFRSLTDITTFIHGGTEKKETFDRDKMFRSLSMALRKRNIDQEKIEKIINAIVRRMENSGDNEIKSNIIGEYIMEALAHLDQVAYVRFASVYKNFREVKDFEDFLDNLEEK